MQMLDALLMMYIDIPEKMNPGVSEACLCYDEFQLGVGIKQNWCIIGSKLYAGSDTGYEDVPFTSNSTPAVTDTLGNSWVKKMDLSCSMVVAELAGEISLTSSRLECASITRKEL